MKAYKPHASNHPYAPIIARIVIRGDRYGLDGCLTHDKDQPLIEFYDERYEHNEWLMPTMNGQFVSRYYLSTLLHDRSHYGLILDGGVPEWRGNPEPLEEILAWAANTTGLKGEGGDWGKSR